MNLFKSRGAGCAVLFVVVAVLMVRCRSNDLDGAAAVSLLHDSGAYPLVISHDVYCGSTQTAQQALHSGLVEKSLITVKLPTSIDNVGQPLIAFTENARPYLVDTPDQSKSIDVQRVKIANEDIKEVTSIDLSPDGSSAEVTYTTSLTDLTPFVVLLVDKLVMVQTFRTSFAFDGKRWTWSGKIEPVNSR